MTPGQGTRSHMPQLRVRMTQRKIPHATSKTKHSQINKFLKKVQLQGQGVSVVPGVEPGWAPSQPRCLAPTPPWESQEGGCQGAWGGVPTAGSQFCSMPFTVSGISERSRPSITQESLGEESSGITHCHPLSCIPRPRQGAHPIHRANPSFSPAVPGHLPVVELHKAPTRHNEGVS